MCRINSALAGSSVLAGDVRVATWPHLFPGLPISGALPNAMRIHGYRSPGQ